MGLPLLDLPLFGVVPRRPTPLFWMAACGLASLLAASPSMAADESTATADAGRSGIPAADVLAEERRRIEVIAKASPAAIAIFAGEQGGGSGVLIAPDGYALTNFHVVQPAGVAMKCGLSDGSLHDAVLVGLDPTGDVALVKLLGRHDFPCAEFGDSDQIRVGDPCFTAGNPFLLATNFQPSISWGMVSGVHRYQFPAGTILEYTDCIQVDAAINPGNSGGALFDGTGRLIGVNGRASFEKRGRVNVGVGYAISINQIRNFLGALRGGRVVDHATLGATVATTFDGRVAVSDILESSDAYRRGLRYDDEIVSLCGRPIRTVNAFKNVLGTLPAGWQVPLVIRREGRRHEFTVRLAGVHSPAELAKIVDASEEPQGPGAPPATKPKAAVPDVVGSVYEPRMGFANHHFNRVERDRVAGAIASQGRFGDCKGEWTLAGRLDNGKPFAIRLSDHLASIDLPTGTTSIDPTEDLDANPSPPGSGGLLSALVLWRRLLIEGPAAIGRTEYLGTSPRANAFEATAPVADGSELPLVDLLVSFVAGVEARFQVEPSSGRLMGIELWPTPDDDPCEIRFEGGCDAGGGRAVGLRVPRKIVVRHGDAPFGTFFVETATLESLAQPAPQPAKPSDGGQSLRLPANRAVSADLAAVPFPALFLLAAMAQVGSPSDAASNPTVEAIAEAARHVVKIHGAGGFRGLESYQSGFLVKPATVDAGKAHVLTVMSSVLDAEEIDCVLDDGRRCRALLVGVDPKRELAVLEIEGEELPGFELAAAGPAEGSSGRSLAAIGRRIYALSNLFGVAAGDERVSVQHGVISAVVPLEARRGGYETAYDGDVYLLDCTVNNPGSPGGVLVDVRGRPLGMLGKELRATAGGTWLNYAIPIDDVAVAFREIVAAAAGGGDLATASAEKPNAAGPFDPVALGIVLVPDLFDKTPPFVETVVPGTAAERAGLRADDLVIAVAGRSVASRAALQLRLGAIREGDDVPLTVIRDGRIVECDLGGKPDVEARPGVLDGPAAGGVAP